MQKLLKSFDSGVVSLLSDNQIKVSYLATSLNPKQSLNDKETRKSKRIISTNPNYIEKIYSESSESDGSESDRTDKASKDMPNVEVILTHKIEPFSSNPAEALFRFYELEYETKVINSLPRPPMGSHYLYRVKWRGRSFLHLGWTTASHLIAEGSVG